VYEIKLVEMQEKTDSTFLARAGFVSDATSMSCHALEQDSKTSVYDASDQPWVLEWAVSGFIPGIVEIKKKAASVQSH
jgi:hypothetical protein